MSKPSVLLNMIVKDESHVIIKTLTNLCNKIKFDYWVISDTGSTDNTKQLIVDFFKNKNIQGELHDDEWKNFGYNRSKALEYAYNKSDLLFVFDADDELIGEFSVPEKVEFDSYHLHFGNGYSLNYWRVCLVNNRKRWKYVGVLHEYISCMENDARNVFIDGDYHVAHQTTGGRSKDPNKYVNDATLLEKAFKELDGKDELRYRYAFYCANSYKDAGMIDKAIEWYMITISLNGWAQERYRSCIMLVELFREKKEYETGLFYALQSYKYDKTRVEGIYKLVQHYSANEMNEIAMSFYSLIQDWYENNYAKGNALIDKLFIDIMDYDFFLPYYMIIVADRVGKREIGVKMYDLIFTKKKIGPEWFMKNLLYNFQFSVKHVDKKNIEFIQKAKQYLKFLEDNNVKINETFYHNIYELING